LGVNGMGIPIGKLALYTACAGIDPAKCLPVHIDVGTNNDQLLKDPLYMGLRRERERGPAYDELVKEFFDACQDKYGRQVLIQFEDFGNSNAFRLLEQHQQSACCFNDDIQGTASVVVAGVISSLPLVDKKNVSDHTFLFYGAGEAGVGIANMLAVAIQKERGCSLEDARKQIWLVDSQGLVTSARPEKLAHHKQPYAHPLSTATTSSSAAGKGQDTPDNDSKHSEVIPDSLLACIERVKPTALIGVSAQGQSFTKQVCQKMATLNPKPLIFALSNPTSKAECTAHQAYEWTNGKCVFASGSPFDPVTLPNGEKVVPGQGNNAYIFPGVGLGAIAAQALTITDDDLYIAAVTLAQQVSQERLDQGCAYPPLSEIRAVSVKIAAAVAANVYKTGRNAGGAKEKAPADLTAHCTSLMYNPHY
jgi:malate dehydrogenase (oxaloacetate-decarboxylating)(NADP+)